MYLKKSLLISERKLSDKQTIEQSNHLVNQIDDLKKYIDIQILAN